MAIHDPVTGLPNRRLFDIQIHQAITENKRQKKIGALLYLDLDNFKALNDQQGHATGDHYLKAFATATAKSLRASDQIFRIGGDEFCILLKDIDNDQNAKEVAEKVIQLANNTQVMNQNNIRVGASVGIALFPNHTNDITKLVCLADTAMYQAKSSGKNQVFIHKD